MWSPETCSDVIFQIEVGEITLTKRYSGAQAFPEFLKDFSGGQHIFYLDDFPEARSSLEQMKIKFIEANYQFSGDQSILGQIRALPGQAPRSIVKCWAE